MATYTSTRKTLIIPGSSSKTFHYNDGGGDIYINSSILRKNQGENSIEVKPINDNFVIYFDSSVNVSMTSTDGDIFTYKPSDTGNSDDAKKMRYKRLDMMIDDDTSYAVLRVNPKLTGNVKVVVDSDSNLYLDTFKVSLGLSQNKYRHIAINPSEYYGRTLMAKMKHMPVDDFYKIEDTCYDLFATANDFDEQYYDTYNYGVRTNTDKMYKENYSLLAPLCVRKVLPDFFLVFKINDYESLFSGDPKDPIKIEDRTSFIDLKNCELIKSFDFREGSNLGTYVRTILENNKSSVGDVYTGYDYDHFNIFNGISVDSGVVANIYEETTSERTINNQVSMNDWYTLGFQRNHIVSKDIINFEFMFDDTSNQLFSLPTYFGLYVRLNGEDETFTCIDTDSQGSIFDNIIHGENFEPQNYPTVIYGISTPDSFVRLHNNVKRDAEVSKHKLEIYKSIITVDTFDISDLIDGNWCYVSNVLNDVLDPGEHYRLIIPEKNAIYEVIASNYFDNSELTDISYQEEKISGTSWYIYRIAIFNVEYRSNIDEKDKPEIIKNQLSLITKAFERFNDDDLKVYNDGESSFSVLYNDEDVMFEKVSSICGFNKTNDDIIKNTTNEFVDESSYLFGCDDIPKIIIDPNIENFESSDLRELYPIGFESLGTRVCYCVLLKEIVYNTNSNPIVLVSEDIQKTLSIYRTVLYKTYLNENKIFNKNVNVSYKKIEGDGIVTGHTDNVYDIVGFGTNKSYMVQFDKEPQIKSNGKMQFYQNYPMNSGICSIFPIKDYNFDVLDQTSVFFVQNENDPTESIRINGDESEYSSYDNVYDKAIIESSKSEEFIADYCDKFKTYNVDSSSLGYMTLDSENDLGLFLSNMQKNGHNKFDVSLISPYCCKWKLLGTDMTGNRMRVMYYFNNIEREIITYDANTWVDGYISVWDPGEIQPTKYYKSTQLIDISQYKDIYVNPNMKSYIDSVGYYYGAGTVPRVEWFNQYLPTTHEWHPPFENFNEEFLQECAYIRVSISLTWTAGRFDDIYISLSKKIDNIPFLPRDIDSYWITKNEDDHVGYVSSDLENSQFAKYISDSYDEDETGSFNNYICTGEGSIDDLLYRTNNYDNKFSKIYKYGDNSIEFVSCGVKIRIKSTDKSIINLSRYVGYSVIAIAMSGNNANQPGTYELFIDETKEQIAFVIYNGIYSEHNRINYIQTNPGTYRIKHSGKLTNITHESGGNVLVEDDGFLSDCSTGLENSKIFIISKPTDDVQESINKKQIILTGDFVEIRDKHIKLSNATCALLGEITTVSSQDKIKELINSNNNVDAYIITTDQSSVATHSLSINNLKQLTTSYAITIKTKNGTKKHNDIASILSIDIVDPFEIKRENSNYEIITKGYVHPSYAVPVMKDILKFNYSDTNEEHTPIKNISNEFETWFDGCNIMISDVNTINQTWMKKVIDIDNTMKQESKETHTEIIIPFIRYIIEQKPSDGETYIEKIAIDSKYRELITTAQTQTNASVYGNYEFIVESVTPDIATSVDEITHKYKIKDHELVVKPDKTTYKKWKSTSHTLVYTSNENNNFKKLELEQNTEIDDTFSGYMELENIGYHGDEILRDGEKLSYSTNILVGVLDASSAISIITNIKYDDKLYGKSKKGDAEYNHEFYYDGTYDNLNTGKTMLSLRSDSSIDNGVDLNAFYFTLSSTDSSVNSVKFDANYVPSFHRENDPEGISNLIHFTIESHQNITVKKYKKASIQIRCDSSTAELTNPEGILESFDTPKGPYIKYNVIEKQNASRKGETTISTYINQSSSVTLLRSHDPLIGYWYTNICRLFSKYDTYESYYGAFSGFEKNNYIASRGINLKTKDTDGNIIHGFIISTWSDSVIDPDKRTISLNVTSSIINFINDGTKTGYSESWNKNQPYITDMYDPYKTKYIENTILKLIDINNNTKFILYVDKSVNDLIFNTDKEQIDTTKFEEVKNLKNTLVLSENRYYMNIENLEPHSYYAEMIINF